MRAVLIILWLCCSARLCAEVVAIHDTVTDQSLDIERVTNMLLGRVTTWSDGSPVIVVVSSEASADGMLLELIGRDTDRLLRGWKRLVYSGGGAMPLTARSNAEALALVARMPGSICVLPLTDAIPGCRIIQLHR
jgi:hypothetical protein